MISGSREVSQEGFTLAPVFLFQCGAIGRSAMTEWEGTTGSTQWSLGAAKEAGIRVLERMGLSQGNLRLDACEPAGHTRASRLRDSPGCTKWMESSQE